MTLTPNAVADRLALLSGYGLTTAEILYRLPDHPRILQTYIWQDYDITPSFPALNKFLNFWRETLEGALYTVRVDHAKMLRRSELRMVGAEFRLN
ncbi:usg protein [Lichenifustis flavocetrariae]|uniref:Usg protein n=1 Tax=Lichenifustis flavocetrariae TaxID=2949735 RepID=A0AA41Z2J2_9HYPH|nr:protein usg [Lichenifustis flavocetrariae]MCW6509338.1 usg protein [Lichenifustis flavocetrariae]